VIRLRLRHLLAAIAVTAVLTACGSAPAADTSSDTPTAASPAADAGESDAEAPSTDMTEAIVDLTWDQTSETDKQSMCAGIALLGTDWAAEQLQQGGGDDSLDWDRAAVLIEGKCETR
jgi:ABC-type glycerol-3-phosphate transport system substrate-binding protein